VIDYPLFGGSFLSLHDISVSLTPDKHTIVLASERFTDAFNHYCFTILPGLGQEGAMLHFDVLQNGLLFPHHYVCLGLPGNHEVYLV